MHKYCDRCGQEAMLIQVDCLALVHLEPIRIEAALKMLCNDCLVEFIDFLMVGEKPGLELWKERGNHANNTRNGEE